MDITLLSNDVTKEFENKVIKIENILYSKVKEEFGKKSVDIGFKYNFLLTSWYMTQNLKTTDTRKKFEERMTELLGVCFNYRKQCGYRRAIWGFNWLKYDLKFVIWLSERGLDIGVEEKMTPNMYFEFHKELIELIVDKSNLGELEQVVGDIL